MAPPPFKSRRLSDINGVSSMKLPSGIRDSHSVYRKQLQPSSVFDVNFLTLGKELVDWLNSTIDFNLKSGPFDLSDTDFLIPLLCYAVTQKNMPLLESFLLEIPSIFGTSCGPDRVTPLHLVCSFGHIDVARFLLENCNVNVDAVDASNWTPLASALDGGYEELALVLIQDFGADARVRTSDGMTMLHLAVQNDQYLKTFINWIIREYPDLLNSVCNLGWSVLFSACWAGNLPAVNDLLLIHKMHLSTSFSNIAQPHPSNSTTANNTGNNGTLSEYSFSSSSSSMSSYSNFRGFDNSPRTTWTIAHVCADILIPSHIHKNDQQSFTNDGINNPAAQILSLIESVGINVLGPIDNADSEGWTPLLYASDRGNSDVVNWLISRGANFNHKSALGWSAAHAAADQNQVLALRTLFSHGACIDLLSVDHHSPLILACWRGHLEATKFLIEEARCKLATCTEDGKNALHVASWSGSPDVALWLIEWIAVEASNAVLLASPNRTDAVESQMSIAAQKAVFKACIEDLNSLGWSALHFAADSGNHSLVSLIAALPGINLDNRSHEGWSPLHLAAWSGRTVTLSALVTAGADRFAVTPEGHQAIHLAAWNNKVDSVKWLKEIGLSIECRDLQGWTPLVFAADAGNTQVVRYLLNSGADTNLTVDDGWSALHFSVWDGSVEMLELFEEFGVDLRSRTSNGKTSIHIAAWAGRVEVIKFFVNKGHSLTAVDEMGWTALHFSADGGTAEAADFILNVIRERATQDAIANGKSAKAAAVIGKNACLSAAHSLSKDFWTPTLLSAWYGHLRFLQVLNRHGIDLKSASTSLNVPHHAQDNVSSTNRPSVDSSMQAKTALHFAAWHGKLDVVEWLVDTLNVPIDPLDGMSWTPLFCAADAKHVSVAQFLLSKGAKVHMEDADGRHPLHLAAWNGNLQIVKILYAWGASVTKSDSMGWTPLHFAADNGHSEVCEWLCKVIRANEYLARVVPLDTKDHQVLSEFGLGLSRHAFDDCLMQSLKPKPDFDSDESSVSLRSLYGIRNTQMWRNNKINQILRLDEEFQYAIKEHKIQNADSSKNADSVLYSEMVRLRTYLASSEADKELITLLDFAVNGVFNLIGVRDGSHSVLFSSPLFSQELKHAAIRVEPSSNRVLFASAIDVACLDGNTALLIGCYAGHIEAAKALYEIGCANIWAEDISGKGALLLAVWSGDLSMLAWLRSLGLDPAIQRDESFGWSALHYASDAGRVAVAVYLVSECGLDVNEFDHTGRSPLHCACSAGHRMMAEMLLGLGAAVDLRDKDGRAPLHYAAADGHSAVADVLLAAGACPLARDREGGFPLDIAEVAGQYHRSLAGTLASSLLSGGPCKPYRPREYAETRQLRDGDDRVDDKLLLVSPLGNGRRSFAAEHSIVAGPSAILYTGGVVASDGIFPKRPQFRKTDGAPLKTANLPSLTKDVDSAPQIEHGIDQKSGKKSYRDTVDLKLNISAINRQSRNVENDSNDENTNEAGASGKTFSPIVTQKLTTPFGSGASMVGVSGSFQGGLRLTRASYAAAAATASSAHFSRVSQSNSANMTDNSKHPSLTGLHVQAAIQTTSSAFPDPLHVDRKRAGLAALASVTSASCPAFISESLIRSSILEAQPTTTHCFNNIIDNSYIKHSGTRLSPISSPSGVSGNKNNIFNSVQSHPTAVSTDGIFHLPHPFAAASPTSAQSMGPFRSSATWDDDLAFDISSDVVTRPVVPPIKAIPVQSQHIKGTSVLGVKKLPAEILMQQTNVLVEFQEREKQRISTILQKDSQFFARKKSCLNQNNTNETNFKSVSLTEHLLKSRVLLGLRQRSKFVWTRARRSFFRHEYVRRLEQIHSAINLSKNDEQHYSHGKQLAESGVRSAILCDIRDSFTLPDSLGELLLCLESLDSSNRLEENADDREILMQSASCGLCRVPWSCPPCLDSNLRSEADIKKLEEKIGDARVIRILKEGPASEWGWQWLLGSHVAFKMETLNMDIEAIVKSVRNEAIVRQKNGMRDGLSEEIKSDMLHLDAVNRTSDLILECLQTPMSQQQQESVSGRYSPLTYLFNDIEHMEPVYKRRMSAALCLAYALHSALFLSSHSLVSATCLYPLEGSNGPGFGSLSFDEDDDTTHFNSSGVDGNFAVNMSDEESVESIKCKVRHLATRASMLFPTTGFENNIALNNRSYMQQQQQSTTPNNYNAMSLAEQVIAAGGSPSLVTKSPPLSPRNLGLSNSNSFSNGYGNNTPANLCNGNNIHSSSPPHVTAPASTNAFLIHPADRSGPLVLSKFMADELDADIILQLWAAEDARDIGDQIACCAVASQVDESIARAIAIQAKVLDDDYSTHLTNKHVSSENAETDLEFVSVRELNELVQKTSRLMTPIEDWFDEDDCIEEDCNKFILFDGSLSPLPL